ncbi:MAG TPA: hypothetical protein VNJ08_15500 [Bacteriovoracaceae bacterium]|nr:hypothetical protein [Bacteriovoracaceae bacterium]
MKFLECRTYICIESRGAFIKQVVRWTVVHLLTFAICMSLFYYGFDHDKLTYQFGSLGLLLLNQGLMVSFLHRILNVKGRVLDIFPDAPRFSSKHFSAIMLVPIVSMALILYLSVKKKKSTRKMPFWVRRPERLAEICLGIFVFTVVTPIVSLIYPSVKLEKYNFWIATPGAYTITQTVEKVRSIGSKTLDPEFLQVSDLSHGLNQSSFYVSALTFDLVQKKLLHDLPKVRTRSLASDNFERELSYVENLCELMKWADNNKTIFSYFHKGYILPTSGWDTSLALVIEHYYLFSFKLQVHREVEHYFTELVNNVVSDAQKEKLKRLEKDYYQIKAVRSLKESEGTWLAYIF